MIQDWYFCCCTKNSSQSITTFLSILKTLNLSSTNSQIIDSSLEELTKTNIWMRIYALSSVLEVIRQKKSTGEIRRSLEKYFESIIANLQPDAIPHFSNMLQNTVNSNVVTDALGSLTICAQNANRHLDMEQLATPYIRLSDFIGETITLEFVYHGLCIDDGQTFANAFVGDDSEHLALRVLVRDALDLRYGRLAFCVAVKIVSQFELGFSRDFLLRKIWTEASIAPEYEPDLLYLTGYLLFHDKTSVDITKNALHEMITLSHLRERVQQSSKRFKRNSRYSNQMLDILRTVGIEISTPEIEVTLPIVYWHSVLWRLSSEINPQQTAKILSKFWQIPYQSPTMKIYISDFGNQNKNNRKSHQSQQHDIDMWAHQLTSLAQLRGRDLTKTEFQVRLGNFKMPTSAYWLFYSPWLNIEYANKSGMRYSGIDKVVLLLRTLSATNIAIDILSQLTPKSEGEYEMASLIIHSWHSLKMINLKDNKHVMPPLELEENDTDDIDNEIKTEVSRNFDIYPQSDQIRGLILFIREYILLCIREKLPNITAETFLRVKRQIETRLKDDETKVDRRSINHTMFEGQIISSVFVDWIIEAYPTAINGTSWISHVGEVKDYFQTERRRQKNQNSGFSFDERMLVALIMRFLSDSQDISLLDPFDWRRAKTRYGPLHWKIKARQLILTKALPSTEWSPEWDDTNISPNTFIARAVERIASLSNEDELDDITRRQWLKDFIDSLNRIGRSYELDRFLRLRLIELLDHQEIMDWLEGQESIVMTILEYGSAYDLAKLFDKVFSWSDENRLQDSGEVRKQVRQRLVNVINADLELTRQNLENNLIPRSPYSVQIEQDRLKMFIALRNRLAFEARFEKQLIPQKPVQQTWKVIEGEADLSISNRPTLVNRDVNLAEWMTAFALYNPNSYHWTLYLEDLDIGLDAINLFDMEHTSKVRFLQDKTGEQLNVCAVVVSTSKIPDQDRYEYVFNCGLGEYQFTRRSIDLRLRVGQIVIVTIDYRNGSWGVSHTQKIIRLRSKDRIGKLARIRVREYTEGSLSKLQLRKYDEGNDELDATNYDLDLWDANLSRIFRHNTQNNENTVVAQLGSDGKWVPVDQELPELLYEVMIYDDGQVGILTLVNTEIRGEVTYLRVSSSPGRNYLVPITVFEAGDAEEIATLLETQDVSGLIIAITSEIINRQVYLRLVRKNLTDPALMALYETGINTPFDMRNVDWNNLFLDTDKIAFRKGQNWYIDVNVPGFPPLVKVEWEEFSPIYPSNRAELTDNYWDKRSGIVYGDNVRKEFVKARDGNWDDFMRRWLSPQLGDKVILKRLIGSYSKSKLSNFDGFAQGLTDENLVVHVELESISMRPFLPHQLPSIEVGRQAEITNVVWDSLKLSPHIEFSDLLPEVRNLAEKALGLFVEVPGNDASDAILCTIRWVLPNGINKENKVRIYNFNDMGIHIGYRITYIPDQEYFQIQKPTFEVSALWQQDKYITEAQSLFYLGTARIDQQWKHIAESTPGNFVVFVDEVASIPHGATGYTYQWQPSIPSDPNMKNIARRNSKRRGRVIGRKDYFRSIITLENNQMFIGNNDFELLGSDLGLLQVRMCLYQRSEELFALWRVFRLNRVREVQSLPELQDDKGYEEVLHNILFNQVDIEVEYVQNRRIVNLPNHIKIPNNTSWLNYVYVPNEEDSFIIDNQYTARSVARLFELSDGSIAASFRRVRPYTVEEFRRFVGAEVDDSRPVALSIPLYYVGPEDSHPVHKTPYDERCHRFEWGRGRMLLVPERKLQFVASSFSNTKFVIFHSDLVRSVRFVEDSQESHNNEDESCIMVIEEAFLRFAATTSLYQQRKSKIVHILHLIISESDVKVDYVKGFNTDYSEELGEFRSKRITLSPTSHDQLLQRFGSQNSAEDEKELRVVILGRLDVDEFFRSSGKRVEYDYVRLTFLDTPDALPLQDEELVFMRAGEIEEISNDMLVKIMALEELEDEVGDDMVNLQLHRRQFSVREDLMGKIYDQQGNLGLFDKILLIRMERKGNSVRTSIIMSIPPRRHSALAGLIASQDGATFGRIVRANVKSVLIEINPGIFVRLVYNEHVEGEIPEITRGSLVYIENNHDNTKFLLTRAAYSDERYIPNIRPTVILPKNDLFNLARLDGKEHTVAFWYNDRRFTIGGLPNIVAASGTYENGAWHRPKSIDMINLMQSRHPKIGLLGKDSNGIYRIGILPDYALIGSLEISEYDVSYLGMQGEKVELEWRFLSFDDSSIAEVLNRINSEYWRYHDSWSVNWEPNGRTYKYRLGRHDAKKGPLFFENSASGYSLRYSTSSFLDYGFPIDELFRSWDTKNIDERYYPVAGVTAEGGLWIELIPGRLIEIPSKLIVWRVEGRISALDRLNWEYFTSGDKVYLSYLPNDNFSGIDQVVLSNWIPSGRGLFGPQKAYLQVSKFDPTEGCLHLGVDGFNIDIPFAEFDTNWKNVFLHPNNQIDHADGQYPENGDVVLLKLDAEDKIVIDGLSNLRPVVDNYFQWFEHPLGDEFVNKRGERFVLNERRMISFLKAVGDSFPVTVETISRKDSILFFSLKFQAFELTPNHLLMLRVCGALKERNIILLRSGNAYFKASYDDIISGLPYAHIEEVFSTLKREQTVIWARTTEDATLEFGFETEKNLELIARVLFVLQNKEDNSGIVVRSLNTSRLYWLPKSQIAWANVPTQALPRLFFRNGEYRTIKLRLITSGRKLQGSMINTTEAQYEFQNLVTGQELTVKIIAHIGETNSGLQRYLAESLTSSIILECQMLNSSFTDNEILPVELVRKVGGKNPQLVVEPIGQRIYRLDLPRWVIGSMYDARDIERPSKRFKEFLENHENITQWQNTRLSSLPNEEIERILCYAYKLFETESANRVSFQLQNEIAQIWISRQLSPKEIELAPALMAIIILHENSYKKGLHKLLDRHSNVDIIDHQTTWRSIAANMIRNLGLRATRSLHVEVLQNLWLFGQSGDTSSRTRTDGMWGRLQQLSKDWEVTDLGNGNILYKLKIEDIASIQRFANAVKIRGKRDLTFIAESLSIATGNSTSDIMKMLNRENSDLREIIGIYRSLVSNSDNSSIYLRQSHIESLKSILTDMLEKERDVTLLDPFPAFVVEPDWDMDE